MIMKINAADAVDDPRIKDVIKHNHHALAESGEKDIATLISGLSNVFACMAAAQQIDFLAVAEVLRLDYLNQGENVIRLLQAKHA